MSYSHIAATFGPDMLDFCVRDGNRYFHVGIVTTQVLIAL